MLSSITIVISASLVRRIELSTTVAAVGSPLVLGGARAVSPAA